MRDGLSATSNCLACSPGMGLHTHAKHSPNEAIKHVGHNRVETRSWQFSHAQSTVKPDETDVNALSQTILDIANIKLKTYQMDPSADGENLETSVLQNTHK